MTSHDFESIEYHRGQFVVADYVIFVLLMVGSLILGVASGIKGFTKATTEDFLVGGRRMHPIPVAMSLIGGIVSALSVLGNSTEMYYYGTQLSLNLIGCFIGTLFVMYIVIPVLYPLKMVSAMQYLELRFGCTLLKKLASISQMIQIAFYLGICLYAPALALSSVTYIPNTVSIIALGLICTIYISLGGVKAVVYTDVLQTSIMFLGVLIVVIMVCIDVGGLSEVFRLAEEGGRLQFFNFDMNPTVRHTFWNVQVLGVYFIVSNLGITQAHFQRWTSVKTVKLSQLLCIMFFAGLFILWSLFYLSGIVAYAAYHDCDPLENQQIEKPDQIIPFLVADKLSGAPGMSGLFVAAVYGAVLSSVSSQASAFSALAWEDFLSNWKWLSDKNFMKPTNITRCLSALAGIMGICVAFIVGKMGTLFQAVYSITGALAGPLTGLFVTGITAPWVTAKGALCGFICSFSFNVWIVLGQFFTNAAKEPTLPLSTSGCEPRNFELTEYATSSPMPLIMEPHIEPSSDYFFLYSISYCYLGAIGILIVYIVSSVVSFITGPNHPDDLDPRVIHKGYMSVYRSLWGAPMKEVKDKPYNAEMEPVSYKSTKTEQAA